jgi:hypothetical protein
VIQTGENTQLGGAKDGLFRPAYQVGIDREVNSEPMKPAAWQMTMLRISFNKSVLLIFFPSLFSRLHHLSNRKFPFKENFI